MAKKKKKKIQNIPVLYQKILAHFQSHPSQVYNYKQIAAQLKISSEKERNEVNEILKRLCSAEKIEELRRGKYRYISDFTICTGQIEITSRGTGYVIVEEMEEDVQINSSLTGKALHGDLVRVELLHQNAKLQAQGRILEVIDRKTKTFVGTLQKTKDHAFVVPDNNKIHVDFFIPKNKLNGGKNKQKVVVELTDWPDNAKNPFARVLEILGNAGDNDVEMHSIVHEFGFEVNFPEEVIIESLKLPEKIDELEIQRRRDFRETLTFTIDPANAKDFDDAISFKKINADHFEVGVHIADVSHYVKAGSALDEEASQRGTSIYLVDRTIPMLPERISNELCSLRPQEEKLTFSAVFKMNTNAQVLDFWFGKGIIYSQKRFTYLEAQKSIDSNAGAFNEELSILNKLAKILKSNRMKNGAISFETEEVEFKLDKDGKPLAVQKKIRKDAHKLIEEFMLLANRSIANHVKTKLKEEQPIAYRVHEPPVFEKLQPLAQMAKKLGYPIHLDDPDRLSFSLNKMLEKVENKPEASVLQPMAIRSMEKAYYTSKKCHHFGLAFEHYCHFTSPIRRYPDLITHRLLFEYINGVPKIDIEKLENVCFESSKNEIRANDAQRASIKYKQTEFLNSRIGEVFEGTISGVTEWGIYVEIKENKCEGMIRLKDIKGDFFEYFEKEFYVEGRRSKQRYTLGESVWVRVKKTNLLKRTIDFEFID